MGLSKIKQPPRALKRVFWKPIASVQTGRTGWYHLLLTRALVCKTWLHAAPPIHLVS